MVITLAVSIRSILHSESIAHCILMCRPVHFSYNNECTHTQGTLRTHVHVYMCMYWLYKMQPTMYMYTCIVGYCMCQPKPKGQFISKHSTATYVELDVELDFRERNASSVQLRVRYHGQDVFGLHKLGSNPSRKFFGHMWSSLQFAPDLVGEGGGGGNFSWPFVTQPVFPTAPTGHIELYRPTREVCRATIIMSRHTMIMIHVGLQWRMQDFFKGGGGGEFTIACMSWSMPARPEKVDERGGLQHIFLLPQKKIGSIFKQATTKKVFGSKGGGG